MDAMICGGLDAGQIIAETLFAAATPVGFVSSSFVKCRFRGWVSEARQGSRSHHREGIAGQPT
jgi:hypothetical protein